MAFGQRQAGIIAEHAEYPDAGGGQRLRQQAAMGHAADLGEDDAGAAHVAPEPREALHQGRDRLRLRAGIHHQDHRPAGFRRDVRRAAAAARCTVEQAHHALGDDEIDARPGSGDHSAARRPAHRPAIEIEGRPAACRGVKGGVDEVRSDLEPARLHAPPGEGAEQPRGHSRLAVPRSRRRNDHAPGPPHRPPPDQ